MTSLIIDARREAYGIDDIRTTMTVGELIDFLGQYEEDTPVYLSHDSGYTYGGIVKDRFEEFDDCDEDDEEAGEEDDQYYI